MNTQRFLILAVLVFTIGLSVVMIPTSFALVEHYLEREVDYNLRFIYELGEHRMSITLKDLFKGLGHHNKTLADFPRDRFGYSEADDYIQDVDAIQGKVGYSFKPKHADRSEEKHYYQNYTVSREDLPKTFYFNVTLTETGAYNLVKNSYFSNIVHEFTTMENKTETWSYPSSGGYSSFYVVGKYSKAINEDGWCINSSLHEVIKRDFSTIYCVNQDTLSKLIGRGWIGI